MFVVVKKCVFSRGDRERVFWSLRRLVGWLGPSLFSVYLLHTHMFGFGFLRCADEAMVGLGCYPIIACVISAFAVFGLGILLDLPRRVVARIARKVAVRIRNEELTVKRWCTSVEKLHSVLTMRVCSGV